MEKRKTKLEDLDGVFELLNELYENKIEYSEFAKKYKESLENSNFQNNLIVFFTTVNFKFFL